MKCILVFLLTCFGASLCLFSTHSIIRKKCQIDENPELKAKFQEVYHNYLKCLTRTPESSRVDMALIENSQKNGTLRELGNTFGNNFKFQHNCFEPINNFGLQCLPKEDQGYIHRTQKAYSDIFKYAFDNNAERFTVLLQQLNRTCFEDILIKCITDEVRNDMIDTAEKECEVYTDLRSCIVNKFQKQCPGPANFFSDILNIMRSAVCLDSNVRSKRDTEDSEILASGKYALLSLVPLRKRLVREIGGAGSKLPHIENRVKSLCNNDAKLEREIQTMKTCLGAKRMFETPRDEYIQHIEDCSKPTRKSLTQCLPQKYQYFPEFFFKLIESVVKLLYDDFGEIARGLSPCMSRLQRQESEDDYNYCVATAGTDVTEEMLASKKRFCDKFIQVSECFIKQLNDTCTTNPDLEKFKTDYIAAMKRPCK